MKLLSKLICFLLVLLIFNSCEGQVNKKNNSKLTYNDSLYTLFPQYKIEDCRRYGIFPDSLNNKIHPKTGKSLMSSLIDFAEKNTITIQFIKGYYGLNLILDSRENIKLHFNNSEFNLVHITNEGGRPSSNINFGGTLILYDHFGTYHSNTIKVDSIIIKSDIKKNLSKSKSRGCHIYKGTDNIHIKYLKVEDLASGETKYKNNHAALTLDGLRDNPTNVTIDELYITSSDRHGAYITGRNNTFKKIVINKYAQGSTEFMTGMQDSGQGEEKLLSGLWINRCDNCMFNNIEIITKNSKNGVPLKLDEGNHALPTIIENLVLDVEYKDSLVIDDILTNILVKHLKIKE